MILDRRSVLSRHVCIQNGYILFLRVFEKYFSLCWRECELLLSHHLDIMSGDVTDRVRTPAWGQESGHQHDSWHRGDSAKKVENSWSWIFWAKWRMRSGLIGSCLVIILCNANLLRIYRKHPVSKMEIQMIPDCLKAEFKLYLVLVNIDWVKTKSFIKFFSVYSESETELVMTGEYFYANGRKHRPFE